MLDSKNFSKKDYEKLIKKLSKSEDYKQNQMQIDCINKVLIEHADVPETLINWLIDSVKENTILEFKETYKKNTDI